MKYNAGRLRRSALGLVALSALSLITALPASAQTAKRTVVVWSERTAPTNVYPKDINGAIAEGLQGLAGWEIITANIDQPEQGLSDALLKQCDVLIWWGHKRHKQVKPELIQKIEQRVKADGMGFMALHSSHFAEPYKAIMGTKCSWAEYKADGTSVKITVKEPNHPIAQGVPKEFDLPKIERYGEPFQVPTPEAVVFEGMYKKPNGETAMGRMAMCWTMGKGKVFYFTPGHETYDDFFRPEVRQIMKNAVQWAAPKK
ncbi:MAG: ThuA domain-containing protein [Verrucomicrobiota bacterium]